ncbi:hypothetical protein AB0L41_47940 [Amycolatopsis mediterranei]
MLCSRPGAAIEAVREISGTIGIKRPTKNAPRLPAEADVVDLLHSVY